MDAQVFKFADLGDGVVDTRTYLPFIAVKNGQNVRMFTDGFIDFSVVPVLKFCLPAWIFPPVLMSSPLPPRTSTWLR
jgi:hypothetical protein